MGCKDLCIRHGFGGFSVYQGRAHFRAEDGMKLSANKFHKKGAMLYLRNEAMEAVQFRFAGEDSEVEEAMCRVEEWVRGDIAKEMNASAEEVADLQRRMDRFAE